VASPPLFSLHNIDLEPRSVSALAVLSTSLSIGQERF
jgi:hypothetical protein